MKLKEEWERERRKAAAFKARLAQEKANQNIPVSSASSTSPSKRSQASNGTKPTNSYTEAQTPSSSSSSIAATTRNAADDSLLPSVHSTPPSRAQSAPAAGGGRANLGSDMGASGTSAAGPLTPQAKADGKKATPSPSSRLKEAWADGRAQQQTANLVSDAKNDTSRKESSSDDTRLSHATNKTSNTDRHEGTSESVSIKSSPSTAAPKKDIINAAPSSSFSSSRPSYSSDFQEKMDVKDTNNSRQSIDTDEGIGQSMSCSDAYGGASDAFESESEVGEESQLRVGGSVGGSVSASGDVGKNGGKDESRIASTRGSDSDGIKTTMPTRLEHSSASATSSSPSSSSNSLPPIQDSPNKPTRDMLSYWQVLMEHDNEPFAFTSISGKAQNFITNTMT